MTCQPIAEDLVRKLEHGRVGEARNQQKTLTAITGRMFLSTTSIAVLLGLRTLYHARDAGDALQANQIFIAQLRLEHCSRNRNGKKSLITRLNKGMDVSGSAGSLGARLLPAASLLEDLLEASVSR